MNKDKHVLPGDMDTFSSRIRKGAEDEKYLPVTKTIYGPNNKPISRVDTDRDFF